MEGLGHFLELEFRLVGDESPDDGIREARQFLDLLGARRSQLIERAYLDFLTGTSQTQTWDSRPR